MLDFKIYNWQVLLDLKYAQQSAQVNDSEYYAKTTLCH